ncbi:MAG: hypothetical protein FWC41_09035 [Firmicutes bacterium]|nr:hypothetical protein [Bacillota bacterium]
MSTEKQFTFTSSIPGMNKGFNNLLQEVRVAINESYIAGQKSRQPEIDELQKYKEMWFEFKTILLGKSIHHKESNWAHNVTCNIEDKNDIDYSL